MGTARPEDTPGGFGGHPQCPLCLWVMGYGWCFLREQPGSVAREPRSTWYGTGSATLWDVAALRGKPWQGGALMGFAGCGASGRDMSQVLTAVKG